MDTAGIHRDTVTTVHVVCPTCDEPVGMPAQLVLWHTGHGVVDGQSAQILVDLDPAREHSREHPGVLPVTLAYFGIPW